MRIAGLTAADSRQYFLAREEPGFNLLHWDADVPDESTWYRDRGELTFEHCRII